MPSLNGKYYTRTGTVTVQTAASAPLAGNYSADIHRVQLQDTSSPPPHNSALLDYNSIILDVFEVWLQSSIT